MRAGIFRDDSERIISEGTRTRISNCKTMDFGSTRVVRYVCTGWLDLRMAMVTIVEQENQRCPYLE